MGVTYLESVTYRWPYAFSPLFSEHPETFGGTEEAKKHVARGSPHRLLAGAKGGAQGGEDRSPRIQGGAHPLSPPAGGERRNTGSNLKS